MNENNVNEVVEETVDQDDVVYTEVFSPAESNDTAKGFVAGAAAAALVVGAVCAGKKAVRWIKGKIAEKKAEAAAADEFDDDFIDDEDDVKSEETK